MKDLKERFSETMKQVSKILGIEPKQIKRDDYIRISVDNGIRGRLNKEELKKLGGFKESRDVMFGEVQTTPKVLLLDVETAPMLGFIWGLWDNNVALNQLHKDWHLLSWSAKWLGSPPEETMYEDQRNAENIEDDSKILKNLWKLMDEADVIVGQNSISFDEKKINARFIQNGFHPPSSYRSLDTMKIAKARFAFTSNKLEYMTSKLNTKYKKLDHAKFSGFKLWSECLKGNIEAWDEMEIYNRYDVLSLEELFLKLYPWSKIKINNNVFSEDMITVCSCGSIEFKKNGYVYSNTGKFQRLTCKKCGTEIREKTNLLSKEKRKTLKG